MSGKQGTMVWSVMGCRIERVVVFCIIAASYVLGHAHQRQYLRTETCGKYNES